MALQHTPEKMRFTTTLPDQTEASFTFSEYLAWRESVGVPIPEKDWLNWQEWFTAVDNNNGRVGAWISVRDFRKEHPNNEAVAWARLDRKQYKE